MSSEFLNMYKNRAFNDCKFVLRNLGYEDLLNKAAAQQLWIKDLEEAAVDRISEVIDLEEELEKTKKEKYALLLQNERLEESILVNEYK